MTDHVEGEEPLVQLWGGPAGREAGPPQNEEAGSRSTHEGDAGRAAVELREPKDELSSARLLRPSAQPPEARWRRAMWKVGFHVGPGSAELRRREVIARIQAPLTAPRVVAIATQKGGVGKTTMTLALGTALTMHRGDRIIGIDGNPDAGCLAERVRRETQATITDLIRDARAGKVNRYMDVRSYTSQTSTGFEVLASDTNPERMKALTEEDYRTVLDILHRYYSLTLVDLGTNVVNAATQYVLKRAHGLVVPVAPRVDGSRVSNWTLDYLEANGWRDLVHASTVVINGVSKNSEVQVQLLEEHFQRRVRRTVQVGFDRHLDAGAELAWDQLELTTRPAILEAAASVVGGVAVASPPEWDGAKAQAVLTTAGMSAVDEWRAPAGGAQATSGDGR